MKLRFITNSSAASAGQTSFASCRPAPGGAAGRPLTRGMLRFLWGFLFPLLLAGCGPKELARLGFDKVESFRAERVGLGSAEGVATVSLYNGNKKSVIFDSGRIELKINGRPLGVVTLQRPVVVQPGFGKTEVPVRIRFSLKELSTAMGLISSVQEGSMRRKPNWRISGSLTFVAGNNGPLRERTVRFDRRLNPELTEMLYKCFPS